MKWCVQIIGEQWTLVELSKVFNSNELFIERDGDAFLLSLSEFGQMNNEMDVLKKAEEYIPTLSGATKLRFGNGLRLGSVVKINDDGTRQEFNRAYCNIKSPTPVASGSAGGAPVPSLADKVKFRLNVVRKDKKVSQAIRIFNSETLGWPELYIIYEIIDAEGGIDKVYKTEAERFTHTANACGHRHMEGKFKPPEKPMNFDEGKAFIELIIENWLRTKA